MVFSTLAILASLAALAAAQQPAYSQCGGQGWTGPTTCVPGYTCTVASAWYWQCLPGTATSSTVAPTPTAAPAKIQWWFSFGDDFTTTGFNESDVLPNASNPFGNPENPGFTSTHAEIWLHQITNLTSYIYNFASYGATTDSVLVPPVPPPVEDDRRRHHHWYSIFGRCVTDQTKAFRASFGSHPASTPWKSDNSIFSVWVGANDVKATLTKRPEDRDGFLDSLITAETSQLEILYNLGARNFLIFNVLPIHRSPSVLNGYDATDQETLKKLTEGFNHRLTKNLQWFKSNYAGLTVREVDVHKLYTSILDNPSAWGFKDVKSPGKGDEEYFWYSEEHPSAPAHKWLAKEVSGLIST